jgi:hypothetical protein
VWEKDLSDGPSPAEMLARNLKELESRSTSRMFLATPRSHGGRRYIGNFSGTCEVKPKKEREGEVSQSVTSRSRAHLARKWIQWLPTLPSSLFADSTC